MCQYLPKETQYHTDRSSSMHIRKNDDKNFIDYLDVRKLKKIFILYYKYSENTQQRISCATH